MDDSGLRAVIRFGVSQGLQITNATGQ